MRVALYRNYREEQQPSMRIYGDMLARHLPGAGVVLHEVRPTEIVPRALRAVPPVAKVGDFLGRYVAAPLRPAESAAEVHHVLDHGNAHLLLRLPAERTVITCHDLIPLLTARGRLPRDHVPLHARALFRALVTQLPRARLLLAVSASTKRDLVQELGCAEERIRVIPMGLQDEHLAPRTAEELLEAEVRLRLGPRPRFLSVGVNFGYKNLSGALRAFHAARRALGHGTLLRVGSPLDAEQRAEMERLGIAGHAHELGRLTVRDLAAVYRLADVLLFPSFYEGFGWPPLEAMAAGLPVVASPCGSVEEVCGEAALYAPPDAPEELAERALRLLRDPILREAQVALGLARAARYRWPETARATADAYREVVKT